MDVAAQWVRITWTKRSRGAPASAARNALPVGFRLPETTPPVTHHVVLAEWRGFEPDERCERALPARHDVSLTEDGGRLRVGPILRERGIADRPRRGRHPAVRLSAGETLRWQVNYRLIPATYGGEWIYRLDTLNLSYGPIDPEVFLRPPTRHVDELVSLR